MTVALPPYPKTQTAQQIAKASGVDTTSRAAWDHFMAELTRLCETADHAPDLHGRLLAYPRIRKGPPMTHRPYPLPTKLSQVPGDVVAACLRRFPLSTYQTATDATLLRACRGALALAALIRVDAEIDAHLRAGPGKPTLGSYRARSREWDRLAAWQTQLFDAALADGDRHTREALDAHLAARSISAAGGTR